MAGQDLKAILGELLDGMRGISRSETVVGEAVQVGTAHVIPVHRLKVAFGTGTSAGDAKHVRGRGGFGAEGAGGAVQLEPLAAITVGPDGRARLFTVDEERGLSWDRLLEQVPEALAKVTKLLGARAARELGGDDAPESDQGAVTAPPGEPGAGGAPPGAA